MRENCTDKGKVKLKKGVFTNGGFSKWRIINMADYQNGIFSTWQIIKMAYFQYGGLSKWQVLKMADF